MRRTVLFTALLGAVPLSSMAQSVVFTNGNLTVPLKPNSSVSIDASGSLQAECVLDGTHCQGAGTAPAGDAATATLARTDGAAPVVAGEAMQLTWSSTNADLCRATTTGPRATSWTGLRSGSGVESVTMQQAGEYVVSLACYGLGGGESKSVSVKVDAAGIPTPTTCDALIGDPNYQPPGWGRVQKSWTQAFSAPDGSPTATYPGAVSFPTPVGAARGTYVTIAFTPVANESVNLTFDQIQGRLGEPYPVRPADGMFFAISPCAGDLRRWVEGPSTDPFLQHGCRKFENSGSLIFSSKIAQSDAAACKVEPGKTYYLHVMPADPTDGLVAGEHSCADVAATASGCDVGVVSQVSH